MVSLQKEVSELTQRLKQSGEQMEALKEANDKQREEMDEAQRAAEDAATTARAHIETLEKQVADANALADAMSKDASESEQMLSQKLHAAQDQLSKVSEDAAETKAQHEDMIATLQSVLGATKDQLSATQADLSQMQGGLERTTRDLESQLAASQEQVAQLIETKAQHEDVLAQLEGELQSIKEQPTMQDNLGRSQEEVAQLTETKAQHEEIIAQLEGELHATKEQLSVTQTDLSQTQDELERTTRDLQGELAGKVESIGVLEQQLAMTRSELDLSQRELERALDTLTANAERLQEEALQVAADMHAMHQSNLNKMQAALRQQHAEAESKLARAAEKQAQVQELLEGELAAHECTTEDFARTKQELERTTCDLQGQIAASQAQVAQLAVTKAKLHQEKERANHDRHAAKEAREVAAKSIKELETSSKDLQEELSDAQLKCTELESGKASLVAKLAELEEKVVMMIARWRSQRQLADSFVCFAGFVKTGMTETLVSNSKGAEFVEQTTLAEEAEEATPETEKRLDAEANDESSEANQVLVPVFAPAAEVIETLGAESEGAEGVEQTMPVEEAKEAALETRETLHGEANDRSSEGHEATEEAIQVPELAEEVLEPAPAAVQREEVAKTIDQSSLRPSPAAPPSWLLGINVLVVDGLVSIKSFVPNSVCKDHLEPGDIIRCIDGKVCTSVESIRNACRTAGSMLCVRYSRPPDEQVLDLVLERALLPCGTGYFSKISNKPSPVSC
jgi:chromosome segregation ATPase